jgi:hypothetical protein
VTRDIIIIIIIIVATESISKSFRKYNISGKNEFNDLQNKSHLEHCTLLRIV